LYVVQALGCGRQVNPDICRGRRRAALYGDIAVKNGRVEQGYFGGCKLLRINEARKMEVYIVES
jgi:isoquinoline 1-oxidoreductase beta subunit